MCVGLGCVYCVVDVNVVFCFSIIWFMIFDVWVWWWNISLVVMLFVFWVVYVVCVGYTMLLIMVICIVQCVCGCCLCWLVHWLCCSVCVFVVVCITWCVVCVFDVIVYDVCEYDVWFNHDCMYVMCVTNDLWHMCIVLLCMCYCLFNTDYCEYDLWYVYMNCCLNMKFGLVVFVVCCGVLCVFDYELICVVWCLGIWFIVYDRIM